MSQQTKDSIYKNNPLVKRYKEVVKLDTFYWSQYPQIDIDSIDLLKGVTANDLAKQVLNTKQSKYYSNKPYNLIGTYNEGEFRDNLKPVQNIETKVTVYDESFISDKLPKAQTDECKYIYKSPDINYSTADLLKTSLGGLYSNLYNTLDLDFLRMYDFQYTDEFGVDRRLWWNRPPKFTVIIPDDYKYYRAYKKDSSIYVILISNGECSLMETMSKPNSPIIISGTKDIPKDTLRVYKYLLVNLNTNAIEKTGYYRYQSLKHPYNVSSYETTYKLIDGKYYLNQVNKNEFVCIPNINHISLNGQYFRVDSVITDPLKVKKIKSSQVEPRRVNYIDQFIQEKDLKIGVPMHD
jgi:hypothetical protein